MNQLYFGANGQSISSGDGTISTLGPRPHAPLSSEPRFMLSNRTTAYPHNMVAHTSYPNTTTDENAPSQRSLQLIKNQCALFIKNRKQMQQQNLSQFTNRPPSITQQQSISLKDLQKSLEDTYTYSNLSSQTDLSIAHKGGVLEDKMGELNKNDSHSSFNKRQWFGECRQPSIQELKELSFQNPHFVKALESSAGQIGLGTAHMTGHSKETTKMLQSFGIQQQLSLNESSKMSSQSKIVVQDSYQLSRIEPDSNTQEDEEDEDEECGLEELEGLTFQDYIKEEDCYLQYNLPLQSNAASSKQSIDHQAASTPCLGKAELANVRTRETNRQTAATNTNAVTEAVRTNTGSEIMDMKVAAIPDSRSNLGSEKQLMQELEEINSQLRRLQPSQLAQLLEGSQATQSQQDLDDCGQTTFFFNQTSLSDSEEGCETKRVELEEVKEIGEESKEEEEQLAGKRKGHTASYSREELINLKKKMESATVNVFSHHQQTTNSSYCEIINIQPIKKENPHTQTHTIETFKKESIFKSSPFASPKTYQRHEPAPTQAAPPKSIQKFIERSEQWTRARTTNIQRKKAELEQRSMAVQNKECTFQPKLVKTRHNKTMVEELDRRDCVENRLWEWNEKSKEKKQLLKDYLQSSESRQCTFKPEINRSPFNRARSSEMSRRVAPRTTRSPLQSLLFGSSPEVKTKISEIKRVRETQDQEDKRSLSEIKDTNEDSYATLEKPAFDGADFYQRNLEWKNKVEEQAQQRIQVMKSQERLEETFRPRISKMSEIIHRRRLNEVKQRGRGPEEYYRRAEDRVIRAGTVVKKSRIASAGQRENIKGIGCWKKRKSAQERNDDYPLQMIDVNREKQEFEGLIQQIQTKLSENKLSCTDFKSLASLILKQTLPSDTHQDPNLQKVDSQCTAYIGCGSQESLEDAPYQEMPRLTDYGQAAPIQICRYPSGNGSSGCYFTAKDEQQYVLLKDTFGTDHNKNYVVKAESESEVEVVGSDLPRQIQGKEFSESIPSLNLEDLQCCSVPKLVQVGKEPVNLPFSEQKRQNYFSDLKNLTQRLKETINEYQFGTSERKQGRLPF